MQKANVDINKTIRQMALKYYKTTDLSKLSPYQLDKLTNWATGTNPNKTRDKNRTYGRYIKGKL